jgi:hypothetical protein
MKDDGKIRETVRRTAMLASLLAALSLPVKADVYFTENFEGVLPPLIGWAADPTQIADPWGGYFPGIGVGGSTAMQFGGTFLDWGGYVAMLYQNPAVAGTAGKTRENTVVAFDLKVNFPEVYGFTIGVQSWKAGWGGIPTASVRDVITWPVELPQDFQTVAIAVGAPEWIQDPYDPMWQGQFEPSGDVYQVWFQLNAWLSGAWVLRGEQRTEAMTIDNIRFWTVIDNLTATPGVLWSPNHKMVDVTVDYSLFDGGGVNPIVSTSLSVSSNEPENGLGDGDTAPDWEVVDANHVRLRAERSGKGAGRIYTITVTCVDILGNTFSKPVTVTVPKSQGK